MKAYRMTAWKTWPEYQEIPQPEPGPGQVLVKVAAAGLCHSDLHVIHEFEAGMLNGALPFTLGHENAGFVEAFGPGATGFEIGEPVAVYGPLGCGACYRCSGGEENLCARPEALDGVGWGLGVDGGLAPYLVVDSPRQLVPLGGLDPVLAAPLTDAAVTPYRAIKNSMRVLVPGSSAVVIGIGGLGHLAVQLLRSLSSSTVIAVDARPDALAMALDMGAHHVVTAGPDAAAQIRELTRGQGADLVMDLVGNDATLALSFGAVRAKGIVKLVGIAGGSAAFGFFGVAPEAEVSSSFWGSITDLREVIALAERGLIVPKVTTYAFDKISEGYHDLESGAVDGRAVVLPNG